jgi:hypothetical protein
MRSSVRRTVKALQSAAGSRAAVAAAAAGVASATAAVAFLDGPASSGKGTPMPSTASKYNMGPLPVVPLEEVQKHTTRETGGEQHACGGVRSCLWVGAGGGARGV